MDIRRPSPIVFELIALFRVLKIGLEAENSGRWRHVAEMLSLFDKLTQSGSFGLYTIPLYLLPFPSFFRPL